MHFAAFFPWAWTKAFTVCFLPAAWCYGRTWAGFKMHWRGMAYRVTWGGWVLEIIRTGAENQAQG